MGYTIAAYPLTLLGGAIRAYEELLDDIDLRLCRSVSKDAAVAEDVRSWLVLTEVRPRQGCDGSEERGVSLCCYNALECWSTRAVEFWSTGVLEDKSSRVLQY